MTATGTGFTAASIVRNSASVAYPTHYVSATGLTFDVNTASFSGGQTVHVQDAGGDSNAVPMTIT